MKHTLEERTDDKQNKDPCTSDYFNWDVMFSPRVSQILSFVAYFSFNFQKFIEPSSIYFSSVTRAVKF